MTTREFLRGSAGVVHAFSRAVYRTQRWMAEHDPREIAQVVAPASPEIEVAVLERIGDRYRRQSTWPGDPILPRSGVEHLPEVLLDGGFIKHRHRYEDVVDVVMAERVVRELGPR